MGSETKTMQDLIGWWGDKTFPNSTADTVLSHLKEEIQELADEHEFGIQDVGYSDRLASEVADVFLLTLQYGHKMGFDVFEAAMQKMRVNMARDWNVANPEPGGHVKHKALGGSDG